MVTCYFLHVYGLIPMNLLGCSRDKNESGLLIVQLYSHIDVEAGASSF